MTITDEQIALAEKLKCAPHYLPPHAAYAVAETAVLENRTPGAKPHISLYRSGWWQCISKADAYSYWVAEGGTPQEAYRAWLKRLA